MIHPSIVASHATTTAEHVVVAENVTKEYRDGGLVVHALNGINLTLDRGEFTAIVGPSGSGKTTFLNLVSGLDSVTGGDIWLAEKRLSRMTSAELSDFRRDHVGFVFQSYNLIPVLTVAENVEYVMLLQGVPAEERAGRVERMLDRLGMHGYAGRFPNQLSGGQQQRVAIARAIVAEPDLILADEPTANLDSTTAGELIDLLRELNEENGITCIFSTHDSRIMERARRLVMLQDGCVDRDEIL